MIFVGEAISSKPLGIFSLELLIAKVLLTIGFEEIGE